MFNYSQRPGLCAGVAFIERPEQSPIELQKLIVIPSAQLAQNPMLVAVFSCRHRGIKPFPKFFSSIPTKE
jgi:hypothetical protein